MVRFEMRGLKDLEQTLARVERAVTQLATVDAALAMADRAITEAEALAPRGHQPNVGRRSGRPRLADSLVRTVRTTSSHHAVVAWGPRRAAFHGLFQEYGTRHHPPQPFLRPAMDAVQREALVEARDVFWGHILRAAR